MLRSVETLGLLDEFDLRPFSFRPISPFTFPYLSSHSFSFSGFLLKISYCRTRFFCAFLVQIKVRLNEGSCGRAEKNCSSKNSAPVTSRGPVDLVRPSFGCYATASCLPFVVVRIVITSSEKKPADGPPGVQITYYRAALWVNLRSLHRGT